MKSLSKNFLAVIAFIAISAIVSLGSVLMLMPKMAGASSPAGYPAQVATSSALAVGPQNNVWSGFGTTTRETAYNCASRVISTVGQPIMISFASLSSTTLTQTVGFQQAASTTVAYDAALYGCGYMTIRGLNSSTTISVMETR